MHIISLINKLKIQFPDLQWSTPPDIKFGVLTTNYAFLLAKSQKVNPNQIAQTLADEINEFFEQNQMDFVAKTVGPYINIDLNNRIFIDLLNNFGQFPVRLNKIDESFVIDMFHPNVGKKMHVGHIRSANLGESMRRILSLKYRTVVSDSYLGDWGIQFSYISWGILHLPELGLEFDTIDIDNENRLVLVDKFYKIYVRMNQLIEEKPNIRQECQQNSKLLEVGMQGKELDEQEKQKFIFLHNLYKKIVTLSLVQFREGELFLNLNHNPVWLPTDKTLIDPDKIARVAGKTGCHYASSQHIQGQFNLTLGESFYISFLSEMEYLADQGLAVREGDSIYIDLEKENLGRVYLISSEGYSLYHTRDIICRMVYAGIFGFDNAITFADLRQKHSFAQVFAVLQRIIDSKIYETKPFGWMTMEETQRALQILSKKMAMFEGFGHLKLPDGAMSTRKGKIFAFEDLKQMLEQKVQTTLLNKGSDDFNNPEKIRKIAVASLKWADLHRDREMDTVFDPSQFLKFEGNTGVYQLYTLVRLKSILKTNIKQNFHWNHFRLDLLNEQELMILKQTFLLPFILEDICQNYKPHHLCNYLFDLATKINSWYVKNSVSQEANLNRKISLLIFCKYLVNHLEFVLSLLGIETVEEI